MTKNQTIDYIREHAVPAGGSWHSNFWRITKELKVFKKVYSNGQDAIANIVIPVGAIIHFPKMLYMEGPGRLGTRKMRASEAFVHSIVKLYTKTTVNYGTSFYDSYFEYKVGKTVKPEDGKFSKLPQMCRSGIHFFLQLEDAIRY